MRILIREGRIKPKQEIVFAPAGGVKGVPGITGLVSAKNDDLPYVILDSDSSGKGFRDKLLNGLYKEDTAKVLEIRTYTDMDQSEIEDIVPYDGYIFGHEKTALYILYNAVRFITRL